MSLHVFLHALRQSQRAQALDHERNAPQSRQGFLNGLGVNVEQQGRFRRQRFGVFAHTCNNLAILHPRGEKSTRGRINHTGHSKPYLPAAARLRPGHEEESGRLSTYQG